MILVTGATGLVGGFLIRELRARRASVRAIVRAGKGRDLARLGIDLREGDLTDPGSYAGAFDGVDAAFLLTPTMGGQIEAEIGFIDAARAAGVSLLVKHSAVGANPDAEGMTGAHGKVERYLQQSGLPHIVVRPTQFMQNLLGWSPPIAQVGAFLVPLVDEQVRVNLVDVEDIAEFEAIALTGGAEVGQAYTISGSELVTYAEVAERLSRGVGERIEFRVVSPGELRSIVRRVGASEPVAENWIEYFSTLRSGQTALDVVTNDVLLVTGHRPRSLEQFARDNAQALRPVRPWSEEQLSAP
jgi:uncharacterized protein YbjT (DUF2867 family)